MDTINFNNVYIGDNFKILGPDEGESNLKTANFILRDLYYGEKSFELAEIKMQKTVIANLSINNNIELIISGDLSNQLAVTNYALREFKIPFLGIYNACSSFIEGLIIASNFIMSKNFKSILTLTSSHINTAERQFRYPLEYGAIKKNYQTITETASIGAIVQSKKTNIKIVRATIGNVVDYGITDVANMGAIMAPAASNIIRNHLYNTNTTLDDYDLIITGDLGIEGLKILINLLKIEHGIIADKIVDAGSLTYKSYQKKLAGASGPTVLPVYFFSNIIQNKKYKKILLVGTGALHNPTMVNQKNSIPGISHLIEIEVNHDN